MIPLVLRPWRVSDVPALRAAIDESLDEVKRWLPWGDEEPSSIEHLTARVEKYARDFEEGSAWRYALLREDDHTLLGTGALLRLTDPEALEVGYWVRTSAAGQGIASRATAALVRHAFAQHGIRRMELWTLPENAPSIGVAKKLGFTLREVKRYPRAGKPEREYAIFGLNSLGELRVGSDSVKIDDTPHRDRTKLL